jgi:excisionase family DNA binding protein
MMTVPELGKLLRISRNKAYEYVRSGAVPSIKVGKQIRIYRGDVLPLRRLRHSSEDR